MKETIIEGIMGPQHGRDKAGWVQHVLEGCTEAAAYVPANEGSM